MGSMSVQNASFCSIASLVAVLDDRSLSARPRCNPPSTQYGRQGREARRQGMESTHMCFSFHNRSFGSSRLAVPNVHATWSSNNHSTEGNLGKSAYDLRETVGIPAEGGMHMDLPNRICDCEPKAHNCITHKLRKENGVDYSVIKSRSGVKTVAADKNTQQATMKCKPSNGGQCDIDGSMSRTWKMGVADNEVLARGDARRFSLKNEDSCLSPNELQKSQLLKTFKYTHCSSKGALIVCPFKVEQFEETKDLLTDSFAELVWGPLTYRPLLAWTVDRYLREREKFFPHALTLVGLYAPAKENELVGNTVDSSVCHWVLAGTVEISLNGKGQPVSPPTPLPPKDAPFLCNMAVQKRYRRRGIGWQLLKAAEELLWQVGCKEIYLHCRMIDEVPLRMYRKAGYKIVTKDSILSLMTFQRRRFLMRKRIEAT